MQETEHTDPLITLLASEFSNIQYLELTNSNVAISNDTLLPESLGGYIHGYPCGNSNKGP